MEKFRVIVFVDPGIGRCAGYIEGDFADEKVARDIAYKLRFVGHAVAVYDMQDVVLDIGFGNCIDGYFNKSNYTRISITNKKFLQGKVDFNYHRQGYYDNLYRDKVN